MLKLLCYTIPFILVVSLSEAAKRSSFGENCDISKRCDSRALLYCSPQGTCQCFMPNTMVFDEDSKGCVTLAGEKCLYTTTEGERNWSEEVPCGPHAKCDSGICTCDANYFELANGTCAAKRAFGEPCSDDAMCRLNHVCGETGVCECAEGTIPEDSERSCVLPAGAQCIPGLNEHCVKDTFCRGDNIAGWSCRCEEGYFQTSNGTCEEKRGHDENCQQDHQCKNEAWFEGSGDPSFLICTQGKCSCNGSVSIENDLEARRDGFHPCVRIAGVECRSDQQDPCMKGSLCKSTKDNRPPMAVCSCDETHFRNSSNLCETKKGFGQLCQRNDECLSRKGEELVCGQEGQCECDSSLTYDEFTGKCLRGVGKSCSTFEACVSNAECNERKECTCQPGYFASNETCHKAGVPGGKCSADNHCEERYEFENTTKTLLVCNNATKLCECERNTTRLHPTRQVCVSKPNSEPNSYGCVPNASFRSNHAGDRCRCNNHATEEDGYCYIVAGQDCDSDQFSRQTNNKTKTCRHGLACTSGVCSCPFRKHQTYSYASGTCNSLVGGPCSSDPIACSDINAECNAEGGLRVCRCKKGFVPVNRGCDLAYGQSCTPKQLPHCDRSALECSTWGKCECPDLQVYNNQTMKCMGLVGAVCSNSQFCGDNAVCELFRGSNQQSGICSCKPGYVPYADRTCGLEKV